jgi:hypothetical protein
MAFEAALRHVMAESCDAAGAALAPFEPWLAQALALGPTPRTGPLRHDVLLPAPGRRSAALTVFPPGRGALAAAGPWASAHLGAIARQAVDDLAARLPAGVRVAGGAAWRGGELWLKLYFAALPALGLGVEPVAVGVDVGARGATRLRAYWAGGAAEDAWLAGWDAPALPPLAGISHRLVGVLGDEKRSLNLIFAPGATLADLGAVAAAVPVAPCLDEALIRRLGDHHLRPTAYEIDLYRDRRETDVLVTLGE